MNNTLIYGSSFRLMSEYADKPVVVCGYGANARLILGVLGELGISVCGICDKNRVGEPYEYVVPGTVKSYENLTDIQEDFRIIISSIMYFEDIKQDVLKTGCNREIIDISVMEKVFDEIPKCFRLDSPWDFRSYLEAHSPELDALKKDLADKLSEETLEAFIKMRLSWNEDYISEIYVSDMYFIPELELGSNEKFMDVGAFNGDTLEAFLEKVQYRCRKVICIEPNKENFDSINKKILKYHGLDIELISKAVTSIEGYICFTGSDTNFHTCAHSVIQIEAITIDSLKEDPTFIKLDIQGEELNALKGAADTIMKFKPAMAVCVYHKTEDLLDVYNFLKTINPGYRFYLRHHANDINDTVLYAV